MTRKKAIVIGAGLGGLSTALRLSVKGYEVEILEKYSSPGGRLNQLQAKGYTFDMGPSFFSMSYEFEEFFKYCGVKNPLEFNPLDPLYAVYFAGNTKPYKIWRNYDQLQKEFPQEKNMADKLEKYIGAAKKLFHDTEDKVIRRNFNGKLDYLASLTTVPLKHTPKMFRSMWSELERNFDTEEVKVIFSLVAFFLGSTPFETPAVYSLLNYTELKHDGYWNVKGGMYKITEEIVKLLEERGVKLHLNTEVKSVESVDGKVVSVTDEHNHQWQADVFVCNADAAAFRGKVLERKKYNEEKLDNMEWTLSPFTIYLGVKGKIENLHHHTYFLGNNFKQYADNIFKTSVAPDKPYYYVNVSSRSNPDCAPEGNENLFILCPVPDLRYKKDWKDREQLADNIIADLSQRVGYDIKANTETRTILDPTDWQHKFNLYRGSGLGLAHGLNQIGGFRPANKDEKFNNLYYVGASTVPGTGLPIVIISSRLATERILKDHGSTF